MLGFKGIFLNRDFCLLDVLAFILLKAVLDALGPLDLGHVERLIIFILGWWVLKMVIEFIREKAGAKERQ
jgi:hypothetical protein